jgi:hypothetical protein
MKITPILLSVALIPSLGDWVVTDLSASPLPTVGESWEWLMAFRTIQLTKIAIIISTNITPTWTFVRVSIIGSFHEPLVSVGSSSESYVAVRSLLPEIIHLPAKSIIAAPERTMNQGGGIPGPGEAPWNNIPWNNITSYVAMAIPARTPMRPIIMITIPSVRYLRIPFFVSFIISSFLSCAFHQMAIGTSCSI